MQNIKPFNNTIMLSRQEIGARLRAARENAGLSRDQVVSRQEIGIGRTTLQQWEGGVTEASLEVIARLSELYHCSPYSILFSEPEVDDTVEEKYIDKSSYDDYVYIPVYDIKVSAGHGTLSEGVQHVRKHLAFRRRWIKARNLQAEQLAVVFTKGDSMIPTIPENAAIVVDMSRNQALDGKVYVIRIDDRLYVKRTQWLIGGGLRLISDNKIYDPLDLKREDFAANNIEVIGQVIHAAYDLPD